MLQVLPLPSVGAALLFIAAVLPVSIVINVLLQLFVPKDASAPPLVFHWIPWFGSAAFYGQDPLSFFFKCRDKYGDVFTFVLFGRRMTVALGPKGNHMILGGSLRHVNAEDAYTHLTTPIFGKGVAYDVPNNVLMEQKRFMKTGLTPDQFRAYVSMIAQETDMYLNTSPAFASYQQSGTAGQWAVFDVYACLSQLTILSASRTLQGEEVRAGIDTSFADVFHDLDGGFMPLNFLFPHLPLPSYRRRDVAHQKMSDFYVKLIAGRRARRRVDDVNGVDMMDSLMGQTYKDGRALSEREIAHIMIALLMAGQHTSSATTSWALLHLSARDDVMTSLWDEQRRVCGKADGTLRDLTYEDFKDLPMLDAVIRETLRLHPPIHSIFRKVTSPITVPGSLAAPTKDTTYEIPSGHFVLSSPAVSQRDPNIWKEAKVWQPSRWLESTGVAANEFSKYVDTAKDGVDYGFGLISRGTESQYLPFGAGRHRCIGEQFAFVQVGTIIVSLVRRLEMKIESKVPEHNYATLITLPKQPCGILYRRRESPGAKATPE